MALLVLLALSWLLCLHDARAQAAAAPVQLDAEEIAWRQQHPVIRVGVYAGDHLPSETWVAGRPEGMAIDYARLLAARIGMRLEFRPYTDWPSVGLAPPGKVVPYDLLTTVPVRSGSHFQYLKPFARAQTVLVARKGDLKIRSEQDLPRARIAIDRANLDLIAVLQARFPQAQLVFTNSSREALDLLASGAADAYIGASEGNTRALLAQRDQDDLRLLAPIPLITRDVAPALPNRNPMLLQLLRKAELSVTPAELKQLSQRWGADMVGPHDAGAETLSPQDRQWLGGLRTLRVGYEVDRAPYTFVNADGDFDGLAADYLELVRKRLGLRLEFVPANDWNQLQRMVRAHEVDMVAAAMPEDFSAQDMLFSRPYEHFPEVIVTRLQGPVVTGPEDLGKRTVAAREEAGLLPRLRVLLPRSQLVSVGSNEAGLDLVAKGGADAYIGTLPAIDALIREQYAATLRISGPAGVDQDLAIGIASDHARLVPLVDRVLRNVDDAQRRAIRSRWLTVEYHYGVPWLWVLSGFGAIVLVLLIISAAYTRSRRALEAKDQAERELAAQLGFQQALLETIPYPVFVKDTQGQYLAINRAYETMFGRLRGELLGQTLGQTRHVMGEEADALHRADLDVMRTGRAVARELRVQLPGYPASRNVLVWLHPFTDSAGATAGLLGTFVDVTDIREAEERARASEQRLKDTNDQLPGAIVRLHIHPDGRTTFDHVTGQTQALFGLELARHEQQDVRLKFVLPEDRAALRAAARQIVTTHVPTTLEFRTLVDGNVRWVRAFGGAPRVLPAGDVLWSVYCGDVTAEKEQARALEEAKATAESAVAAKGAFLAMMSHEIRTPMAGVLGLIELMAQSRLDAEQKHMLGLVQDSAATLLQILDDILDFSRIDSGRLELELRPFDLRTLADGVIGLFAARALEKGVRLHATIDWRLAGEFSGDAVRVRQIITNLISNALKFTQKGHVELCIELLGEAQATQELRITVADTGIGISREQLDHLFQPFVQAESSITRRFGGTGLACPSAGGWRG